MPSFIPLLVDELQLPKPIRELLVAAEKSQREDTTQTAKVAAAWYLRETYGLDEQELSDLLGVPLGTLAEGLTRLALHLLPAMALNRRQATAGS